MLTIREHRTDEDIELDTGAFGSPRIIVRWTCGDHFPFTVEKIQRLIADVDANTEEGRQFPITDEDDYTVKVELVGDTLSVLANGFAREELGRFDWAEFKHAVATLVAGKEATA